ncbi:hypothetical protein AHAS_Ahas19G0273000 [Arachis hypogaea]
MTITMQDVAYQLGLRIDGDPTKWTMKLTWFQNTNCGELEQDATEERLMRYTRGCIMQLIEGILFPDASDSRVHIRWLLLLEDLERCGQSPSMAVLPDVSGHGAWPTQFGRVR